MLPSTVKFASRMKKMGVGDGMRIVVYDTQGLFSAARVWWTFRAMGHEDVAVLNGGLKKWTVGGARTWRTARRASGRSATTRRCCNASLVRDMDDMKEVARQEVGADRRCAPGGAL